MDPDKLKPFNTLIWRRWSGIPATNRGILLIVGATILAVLMQAAVRELSSELHPFQILFVRNLFATMMFLPLITRNGLSLLKTEKLFLHLLRSVLYVAATMASFVAISITPLARFNALGFTAPLFAALLSVVLLGERFHLRRWLAILFGFLGTLIILRPGFAQIDFGSWLTLMSAAIWGLTMVVIRVLGRTESSLTSTAYLITLVTVFSFVPAVMVWQTPQGNAWLFLLFIAVTGTGAQWAITEALKVTETTVVIPFDFLRIVWASILGFILFSEVPTLYTWTGAAIILASGFYVAKREQTLAARPEGHRAD